MSPRIRYLVTTLLLVAIGLGYALVRERMSHPSLRLPARAEAVSRPRPPLPPSPTAGEVLERAADLSLTAEQRRRLLGLDAEWQQESTPLEARLRGAEAEFSRFMGEAQQNGKVSLQEIQRHSEDVRRLGAAWREAQERQAEAVKHVLTESQQKQLASVTSQQPSGGMR